MDIGEDTNVMKRFFNAICLTLRFIFRMGIWLALLLIAICAFFRLGNAVFKWSCIAGVAFYFTVAFIEGGRGNVASTWVALLAGLTGVALYESANENVEDWTSSGAMINPATGLAMVGAVDTAGNAYGTGTMSEASSMFNDDSSVTTFDSGSHFTVNPANGLPMINDNIDIHGNAFGTNFMDNSWTSGSSSMFDND